MQEAQHPPLAGAGIVDHILPVACKAPACKGHHRNRIVVRKIVVNPVIFFRRRLCAFGADRQRRAKRIRIDIFRVDRTANGVFCIVNQRCANEVGCRRAAAVAHCPDLDGFTGERCRMLLYVLPRKFQRNIPGKLESGMQAVRALKPIRVGRIAICLLTVSGANIEVAAPLLFVACAAWNNGQQDGRVIQDLVGRCRAHGVLLHLPLIVVIDSYVHKAKRCQKRLHILALSRIVRILAADGRSRHLHGHGGEMLVCSIGRAAEVLITVDEIVRQVSIALMRSIGKRSAQKHSVFLCCCSIRRQRRNAEAKHQADHKRGCAKPLKGCTHRSVPLLFLKARGRPGIRPLPHEDYFPAPSQKRIRMVAICARVALPCGRSFPPLTPLISPAPQAHCNALIAQLLTSVASL